MPGVEFVELADNREHCKCCGGGGIMEIVDRELALAPCPAEDQADSSHWSGHGHHKLPAVCPDYPDDCKKVEDPVKRFVHHGVRSQVHEVRY